MLQVNHDYDFCLVDEISANMENKLFCTFSTEEGISSLIRDIKNKYSVIYNKIFVLEAKDQGEFIVTYNLDLSNVSSFLENTILVHRKKEFNALYTINALNLLIRERNGGVLDTSFVVNWNDFRNSILLTKEGELRRISTRLHKIVEI